ncbi:hypothetical protein MHTCC0001_08340 [Flavobacteriaceae bacterium MHTCC 0001]
MLNYGFWTLILFRFIRHSVTIMKRSKFIISLGLSSVLPAFASQSFTTIQEAPQIDKALVKQFVEAAHGKLDVVKALLAEHPILINAAHDWKFGDFETALGGASHMGNKEIVKYLLNHGAQANIFTAALFGKLDVLKSMLEFSPKLLYAKGPHGFTLLHHANKGGEEALPVKEYLIRLGLEETLIKIY